MGWTREEAIDAMVEYWTKWVRGEGDPVLTLRPRDMRHLPAPSKWVDKAGDFARELRIEVEEAYDITMRAEVEYGIERTTIYNDYHPMYRLWDASIRVWPDYRDFDWYLFPHKTRAWFTKEGVPMVDEDWRGPGRELPKKEG